MAWYDTAVNAAVGVGTTFLDNFFGGRRAEHDRERNYYWNSKAAQRDYELAKQWYDTYQTPAAIMGQLQQAGLSPSMMAKGALGSGQGSGVGSHGAGDGVQSPFYDLGGKAMQVAQIDLMKAEANKANAEAQNARGEGKMGEATLNQIIAETNNKEANTKLVEMQQDLTKVETELQKGNIKLVNYKCKEAENNAAYVFWQAEQSKLNWKFDKQTFDERIKIIKQDLANKTIEYALNESNIQLNAEQKSKLIVEAEQIYNNLFYYTDIDVANADAYQKWMRTQSENLPEQLKVLQEQLKLGKTKMWLDFGSSIFNTACHTAGMLMFGKKGGVGGVMQGVQNPVYTPYNAKGASGANAWHAHKYDNWWGN